MAEEWGVLKHAQCRELGCSLVVIAIVIKLLLRKASSIQELKNERMMTFK